MNTEQEGASERAGAGLGPIALLLVPIPLLPGLVPLFLARVVL
jgi:hypothetical protein